jgi:D-sedoheptulose 7-phosphate isomerase
MDHIKTFLDDVNYSSSNLDKIIIKKIILELQKVQIKKGRLVILGVGGSAGNASHAVNDFRKLCKIDAYTPIDNVSEITARTNDEGWETVFDSWMKIFKLNKNDKILIFSVGGGNIKKKVSINLVRAINYAKKCKSKVISIVGKNNGYAFKKSDLCLLIPTKNSKNVTPISEAFQAVVWHLLVSHPLLQKNKTKW